MTDTNLARRIRLGEDSTLELKRVLLCSEDKPHRCHRRLVAEYLKNHWGNVEIAHLG